MTDDMPAELPTEMIVADRPDIPAQGKAYARLVGKTGQAWRLVISDAAGMGIFSFGNGRELEGWTNWLAEHVEAIRVRERVLEGSGE